jgi:antitoxin component HigA of HigAB toxin-antitoxin module
MNNDGQMIRPIKTEADYEAALARVDSLTAGDRSPAAGTPESDELDVLITLIQAYEAANHPVAADHQDDIDRLVRDCAEAYQVVGAISADLEIDEHPDIVRALDNLSAASEGRPRPHEDLLPFPRHPLRKP